MRTRKAFIVIILLLTLSITNFVTGQNEQKNYLTLPWKVVATRMPEAWYGSGEAKMAADSVLKFQSESGGWPKNMGFHNGSVDKEAIAKMKATGIGSTFDNDATITELRFLARIYSHINDPRYKKAFEKGLDFRSGGITFRR